MKVYIGTDSEGQACVTREEDPKNVYGPWQADYIRKRATQETTAAIEGAREAGATEIVVQDIGFIRGVSPGGLILHYDELPRGIRIGLGGAPYTVLLMLASMRSFCWATTPWRVLRMA